MRSRTARLVPLLSLAAVLTSAPAFAEGPSDPPKPTVWYGGETLALDAAALVMLAPAAASTSNGVQTTFASGSLLTYGLGAPIVHFAHGHVGTGFADLGIRLALPALAGLVGGVIGASAYQAPTCTNDPLCDEGFGQAFAAVEGGLIGGALGIAGAVTIDAVWLAREPAQREGDRPASPSPASEPSETSGESYVSSVHLQPTFGLGPERQGGTRAVLGLAGTF
jgi:hypothetical protein